MTGGILCLALLATTATTAALTVVVTGSSQGIGLDAARRLVRDGHDVVHACRSEERAHVAAAASGGGIPMVCDLASLDSVREFAESLLNGPAGRDIDVLCLNAAVAPSRKAARPRLSADGFEECVATNHLGHFLLANLLEGRLSSSPRTGGRIVVTASSVHDPESPGGAVRPGDGATLGDLSGLGVDLRRAAADTAGAGGAALPTMVDGSATYNGAKVYNDSKLCNVLFAREARRRMTGLASVRSFNPGFIPSSGLFRAPREDNWLGATAFAFAAGLAGFAVPIEVGGERLAYVATAGDDEVPSGSYLSAETGSRAATRSTGFDEAEVSKEASDDDLARELWDRSLEIVGM